jgi:pilus assembly protein Flp/PilA
MRTAPPAGAASFPRLVPDGSYGLGVTPSHTPENDMKATLKNVVEFLKREDGPTAVEYAVMLALIVVVCIAAITAIGAASNQTFSSVGSSLKPS